MIKVQISLFSEICENKNENKRFHCFLNKEEIKQIINNIRFFNFESDFVGVTKGKLQFIYIKAKMKFCSNESITILVYLAILIIALMHEIIGHLNIRFQNFVNDTKIKSPKPEYGSSYAIERGRESGEFVEEKLFGNYKCQMNLREILFSLDIKNYNNYEPDEFRKNFKSCKNLKLKDISNELKNILQLLNIIINDKDLENSEIYIVQKNKREQYYYFGQHHSMNQIDLDDDDD